MENTTGFTEFGEMLKILMVKNNNLKNKELAEKTKCSQANITNILHGKTCPDLHFLTTCQKFFNLDQKDTLDFFAKAFSSSKTISIDTSHFLKERLDWIAKIIVILLFLPEIPNWNGIPNNLDEYDDPQNESICKTLKQIRNIAEQYISVFEEHKVPLDQLVVPEKRDRKKRTAKKP
jgi:transcriptional regulator with XRE-family HTH domain